MNRVILLQCLKDFTEEATKDLLMPVKIQSEKDTETERRAEVHLMRLPDSKAAHKKAPYVLHQFITGEDQQTPGNRDTSTATVRSIFCVYSDNEEKGGLILLNLMERLRIALLRQRVIGEQFTLDLEAKLEALCYPDDTAPYFAGEMVSVWKLPAVEREVIL